MASYRFCRSDDVPLLVAAYNACYRAHFPGLPDLRVEDFKRAVRDLDLWTSSCMVACSGDEPIGVLLAAKRETENLIYRVGIAPDRRRQGHGRHLLDSLAQKMAILGPPGMLAELPESRSEARAFLEACGYRRERTYTDFEHPGGGDAAPPSELVIPASVDDLVANDALDRETRRPWERDAATLVNRKDTLRGIAVASDTRIEAYLLFHDPEGGRTREIAGFHCVDPERSGLWLGLLFGQVSAGSRRPVRLPRVDDGEIAPGLLESWGFRPGARTAVYAARAKAG